MDDEQVKKQLTAAFRRALRYSLGDALEFTKVSRPRLMRWLDAGIIETAGGGSQGKRREFSFRNLVEINVCDELRGLGVNEEGLRSVVRNLNAIWNQPDEVMNSRRPERPTYRQASILWLAFQRHVHPDDGSVVESICCYPSDAADVVSRLTTGDADGSGIAESGIALPIARIVADLERETGDELTWGRPE